MALKIQYVEEHQGGQRYRRRIPIDVREKLGGQVSWYHTFPARTPLTVIERKAKQLSLQHDREIASARGQELSSSQIESAESFARKLLAGEDKADLYGYLDLATQEEMSPKTAAVVNALEHGGRYVPESLALSAVLERDTRLYGGDRDPRPINYAVESFIAVIGDKQVTDIVRGDVTEWLASQTKKGLAPATQKRRLGALCALVNRAFLDFNHDARNPFSRHKIIRGSGGVNDRLPLNRAMFDKIDAYLSSNKRLGHETKNLLRIMRNTGAGPAEVSGLVIADVSLDSNIPYIWVRPNSIRRIKTEMRDRQIPLLGVALEAATDAVKRATGRSKGKSRDKTPLFTGFGISGRGADSISVKLNKAIRAAGVPRSPRLTSYSMRHSLKEALRSAGVADHVQRRILGHSGHGVADRYGSPRIRLNEARDALIAAFSHLGDVDSLIYSERELIKKGK